MTNQQGRLITKVASSGNVWLGFLSKLIPWMQVI